MALVAVCDFLALPGRYHIVLHCRWVQYLEKCLSPRVGLRLVVGRRVVSFRYLRWLGRWYRYVRPFEQVLVPVFFCTSSPCGLSCRKSYILLRALCICSPRVVGVGIRMIGIPCGWPTVAGSRGVSRGVATILIV